MHGSEYRQYDQMQHRANQATQALLLRAAESVPEHKQHKLLVADYGSSVSTSSAQLLAPVVQQLASKAALVSVAHVDLPENDWQALSEAVQSCAGSYVHVASNVSSQQCARSFYTQCFPAATVSLGWSGIALQWLSASIPQAGHLCCTPSSMDSGAISKIKAQAQEDWRVFLAHRATELKPGAHLIVTALCLLPGESTLGQALDQLNRQLCDAWRLQLGHGLGKATMLYSSQQTMQAP
ncbi:hypothetical protein WJX74_000716 [Apatococcus lobatus]|uniref:Uncharacterized protein n=1 Tax=Apatococcus lobatus TaxID=904363 RepID=A0AAW1RW16_9CHLO